MFKLNMIKSYFSVDNVVKTEIMMDGSYCTVIRHKDRFFKKLYGKQGDNIINLSLVRRQAFSQILLVKCVPYCIGLGVGSFEVSGNWKQ